MCHFNFYKFSIWQSFASSRFHTTNRMAQKVQLDNVKTPTIYGCTRFDNSEILKSAKSFWMLHGRPAASCACPCTTGMPRPSKSLMSKHAQNKINASNFRSQNNYSSFNSFFNSILSCAKTVQLAWPLRDVSPVLLDVVQPLPPVLTLQL